MKKTVISNPPPRFFHDTIKVHRCYHVCGESKKQEKTKQQQKSEDCGSEKFLNEQGKVSFCMDEIKNKWLAFTELLFWACLCSGAEQKERKKVQWLVKNLGEYFVGKHDWNFLTPDCLTVYLKVLSSFVRSFVNVFHSTSQLPVFHCFLSSSFLPNERIFFSWRFLKQRRSSDFIWMFVTN